MTSRATVAVALVAGVLLGTACSARQRETVTSPEAPEALGVYRGQAWDASGRKPRFRLLLHARPPDRVHAEMIPPVGGPAWILDAGDGRVSLTVVAEATAYVGSASAEVVRRLLGVAVEPEAFVRALLSGEAPGGRISVERLPSDRVGLPGSFELRDGERGFRLELVEIRRVATHGLGNGAPPPGTRQVPIEDLGDAPRWE